MTSPHQSPEHSQPGSESALPTTGRSCTEWRLSRAGSAVVVSSPPPRSRKRSPAVACPRGRRLWLAAGLATTVSQRSRVGERPRLLGTGGGWLLLLLRAERGSGEAGRTPNRVGTGLRREEGSAGSGQRVRRGGPEAATDASFCPFPIR